MKKAKRMSARSAIRACAVMAAVLGLAGCGALKNTYKPNPGSANEISVVLQGQPDASDIGIYEAQALGYLKQTDLDVTIRVPGNGPADSALQQVYNAKATIGLSDEPGVLFARNSNEAVVAVAAAVQHPLDGIVSLASSRITTIPQLRGKTIAVSGGNGARSLLGAMLSHAGVPVSAVHETVVDESQLVPDLLSGRVDATFGGNVDMETAQVAQKHGQVNSIAPSAGGVPDYNGLVVVVQKGEIVDHAPVPRRFVQAVARGYAAVRRNPTQAVDTMIKQVPSLAPQRDVLLAAVEAELPDFFPTKIPKEERPWGFMTVSQWNRFGTYMHHAHLLTNGEAPIDASTNELLAGQGV